MKNLWKSSLTLLALASGAVLADVKMPTSIDYVPQLVEGIYRFVPSGEIAKTTSKEALLIARAIAGRIHGGVARVADTGSMEPTLVGSDLLVFIAPQRDRPARVGDIVLFGAKIKAFSGEVAARQEYAYLIAHRVVRLDSMTGYYITKGDANKHEDDEVVGPKKIMGIAMVIVHGNGVLSPPLPTTTDSLQTEYR